VAASGYLSSTSMVENLTVTGSVLTETYLTETGSAGNYGLTATVYGTGRSAPGGNVSFVDTSNGNAVHGTAVLNADSAGLNFLNSALETTPYDYFRAFAPSDFNWMGSCISPLRITQPTQWKCRRRGGYSTSCRLSGRF
jgi:hypothetical protein